MGSFAYRLILLSADGSRQEAVEALVDTGSTYTLVPSPILARLGARPQWAGRFQLADGREEEYSMGEVRVRLDGEERTTVCIFGTTGSTPLLGAVTLESFGLMADPVNQRLVPARLYLA